MIDLRFSEEELDTVHDRITTFIADTVREAGADGAVLGLSGGIDSTLTAYVATEALGAKNLHGLVLPGTVSSDENMSDAERVAQELEIPYDVIEINPIIERFVAALPETEGDHVAVGNTRARTRAVLNYLLANHENRIVLGTGNRAEAAVGYYTKYGDGAVDCHPIGNLYKQQVRQLARHVGVSEELAAKTPTAELWEDQTDEGELGIDYDTLDTVIALHIDGPLSATATSRAVGCNETVVREVVALYEQSAHKRAVPPAPER